MYTWGTFRLRIKNILKTSRSVTTPALAFSTRILLFIFKLLLFSITNFLRMTNYILYTYKFSIVNSVLFFPLFY